MVFEVDDELMVKYHYGYGAISPFFEAIAAGQSALRVSRCPACQSLYCPPRMHCQACWTETEWEEHSGTGTIESLVWAYWVPIDSPARRYTSLPYAYAAVRLDGCRNLLRVRATGVGQDITPERSGGLRGQIKVVPNAVGKIGDLYFEVDAAVEAR
jgi:uncharacterized OB-fold protein